MKSADIRQAFLDFFRAHGHEVVASSPLVPANDQTLLFTNAGMVQFKEVFLGLEPRPYQRATSVQRCVRAGGKHNDLENVGYTARHHTFFEMLGNFSFGDYFKRDAIRFAWQFLTETMGLPPEKLWVTVFEEDDEAADIWLKEVGVDASRFSRIGAKDNFWSMGDTGPCGPCSEIFYDHGPSIPGGPPGSEEADGDRYIEIWNLVFMQFDRDKEGKLTPLPKPSVDTGMGLERLAAVLQHVHSNYEIDTFQALLAAVGELAGHYEADNPSFKVIADHIRSCAFLITDGVIPSNEGRGYVLRRIIRRAIRHGHKLGLREPFFHKLVGPLCLQMGAPYPELERAREQVERVLRQEEERFAETLDQGMRLLEQAIAALSDQEIAGETVFTLYDTYGFPVDLTADIARERGLSLDMAGFEREMAAQRERARAASQFKMGDIDPASMAGEIGPTAFHGYDRLEAEATVIGLFRDGQPVDHLATDEQGVVVLDATPFYAESGGQIGDSGLLEAEESQFAVQDTQKQGETFVHIGTVTRGNLRSGQKLVARVTGERRQDIAYNHSATHLLHAALKQVLGEHVRQKGSLVSAERLRFDFAHFEALSPAQIAEVERLVNRQIRTNDAVETRLMAVDEALASGATALFGEKYGDTVRVLRMGEFSTELCGGTHVGRTGDIGLLKVVSEGGVAAGVRRIEAVTGRNALAWIDSAEGQLEAIAGLLKSNRDGLLERVQQLVERSRKLERELDQAKGKLASSQGSDLASQALEIAGIKVLAARIEGVDSKALREMVDQLKNKLGAAAVVLAAVEGDKVSLIAGVTKAESAKVKAGDLVNMVATQVGGRGGGRPDMAQAGGNDPSALPQALASVAQWVAERMGV